MGHRGLAGKTVTAISAGQEHTCAVAAGAAYCWGYNGSGRLGNNSTANSTVPVAVGTGGPLADTTVATIAAGGSHTAVLAAVTPQAPTAVAGQRADRAVTLSWTPPTDDGGATITGYTATAAPGGQTCTTSTTSCTVEGLTNGQPYTFIVVATNAVGDSPASGPSDSVTPRTTPNAPNAVTGAPGDKQVTVSWTPPTDDGGATITGYTATAAPGGQTCTTSTTSCTVEGLTNGQPYTFIVVATNAVGDSPASLPSDPVTPRTTPNAPNAVTGAPGDKQVTVSWTPPTDNGGSSVTQYQVTAAPGGQTCTTSTTSCTVEGLTNGQPYTFTVVATNAVGDSPASGPADPVTPRSTAGAPSAVSGTPGDKQVKVSWTAPGDNGGSSVTQYQVTASTNGATCTTGGTSCTVEGLANGQPYTFTVVATNDAGDSPASDPSDPVTPRTVPSAPIGVTAGPRGPGEATVGWLAPSSDGGATITGYTATASPGGATCTTSGTSCTISGLNPGGTYTFYVVATNIAGDGPASQPAPPVGMSKLTQTATVKVAKKIKPDGRTVLLKKAVTTNADQMLRAKVTVGPKGKGYAKVTITKKGKVIITTTGKRNLKVTLRLTAAATAQYNAYSSTSRWKVKKA